MTKTCPACGHEADGRFCSNCGAGLDATVACTECGNQLPRGGRFCNQCGTPTPATRAVLAGAAASPASGRLPWVVAGVALVALLAVVLVPRLRDPEAAPAPTAAAPAAGPFAGGGGDPRSVDLSSMTPREAADRLFNRVMQSVSDGDSAQARQFLPMAIGAYQRVPELDLDGRYHVAVLQMVGGNPQAARAQADTILRASPTHLFGLFTAAQADQAMGNAESAGTLYRRFLQNYDAESRRTLPEYTDHQQLLPIMKAEAEKAVGGQG